ncbi:Hypothetical protein NTJ_13457 [Nesidiocoris tenuis]|uniref:Uncharacterized protein n=1 Tax=Nesidiocoris tenuis TaxID=355587 RepID=A0ABN7B8C4_9HEMI|nr:Hypothetical protein NTJ_13457 [Nesidiocoris tenuis]
MVLSGWGWAFRTRWRLPDGHSCSATPIHEGGPHTDSHAHTCASEDRRDAHTRRISEENSPERTLLHLSPRVFCYFFPPLSPPSYSRRFSTLAAGSGKIAIFPDISALLFALSVIVCNFHAKYHNNSRSP